ncbi:DUF4252 domain-containing protein [Kordia sp. YSTF-M3]|uniref:DUF4252 domain-containing protein n=1 Tax=Kordia aestuariivivens TaxID=2759037 RepID=A0ABR7QEC2_9FLAO|nr:DUF4252 domain-containing protein [Kordia aestuariivivens]MBC8756828.1 DUF4252 domain-containing protein [Kordia aestuariivivens]
MKTIKSILVLVFITIGISSCSDKNSLQNYILENAEKVGFSSSSIPKSLIKPANLKLTPEQQIAYDAVDRVNVLIYKYDQEKKDDFELQNTRVKTILKQKKYEELMNFGSKGIIKYSGEENAMDEIIIFLSNKEMGFAVARVSGNDMTMNKFMELYKMVGNSSQGDFNLGALTSFITN